MSPLDVPAVIVGERVRLRPPELGQAATFARWVSDPGTRHLLGAAAYQVSVASEEDWLRPILEGTDRDRLFLCIEATDTPESVLIGTIELRKIHPEFRRGEVGVLVGDAEYRGKGYGTDALRALCRFAFDEIDIERITLEVHDFNARAIAAYRKVGFVEEGRFRRHVYLAGRYYDTIAMGLLREDFAAAESNR